MFWVVPAEAVQAGTQLRVWLWVAAGQRVNYGAVLCCGVGKRSQTNQRPWPASVGFEKDAPVCGKRDLLHVERDGHRKICQQHHLLRRDEMKWNEINAGWLRACSQWSGTCFQCGWIQSCFVTWAWFTLIRSIISTARATFPHCNTCYCHCSSSQGQRVLYKDFTA